MNEKTAVCLCEKCFNYAKCLEFSKRMVGGSLPDEKTIREILKTFDIQDVICMFGGLLVSKWLKGRR